MTAPEEVERLAAELLAIDGYREDAKVWALTCKHYWSRCAQYPDYPAWRSLINDAFRRATGLLKSYSRTAETLERAARVALNHASRKAMQSMSSDTPLTDMQLSKQAQSIAAAIRAGKGE